MIFVYYWQLASVIMAETFAGLLEAASLMRHDRAQSYLERTANGL